MDETEYRSIYRQATPVRCVFEKAILLGQVGCSQSVRVNIAERQGVNCQAQQCQQRCAHWLELLRSKATFALHMADVDAPLPHAKQIKIQAGGIAGLRKSCSQEEGGIPDVDEILNLAVAQFGSLEAVPFVEVIKDVAAYQGRRRSHGPTTHP